MFAALKKSVTENRVKSIVLAIVMIIGGILLSSQFSASVFTLTIIFNIFVSMLVMLVGIIIGVVAIIWPIEEKPEKKKKKEKKGKEHDAKQKSPAKSG